MKPDAITALFADASAHFVPFAGNPTDDDLTAIREVLTPLLLGIPYDADGRHNLVGLIAQRDKYKAKYSVFFARPKRPLLYDDTIDAAATPVVRTRAEAIHTAKLADYAAFEAAERAVVKFIRTAVDETWYKDLKDSESFYNAVTAADLIDHLDKNCGGLHAIDLVNLPTEMLAYYAAAEGIPEYINMLEDAQRKAQRAAMPIADVQLVAIASTAVLGSQQYPRATEDWEALATSAKTWTAWKKAYRAAHIARKRQLLASGTSEPFGGAHAASTLPPEGTLDRLDGYLDNLANAATQEKSTFAQLVANNASLTTSFEALAAAYASLAGRPAPAATAPPAPPTTRAPRTARAVNYATNGYCWSHGYKVGKTHSSITCNAKADGHQAGATRANIMGGSTLNKGWGEA